MQISIGDDMRDCTSSGGLSTSGVARSDFASNFPEASPRSILPLDF
jgi:hypothetical protein